MDSVYTLISTSPDDTHTLGRRIALEIINEIHKNKRVICLRGDLGSGKTVLVKGFLSGFGVTSRILSPTFTIEKSYEANGRTLHHFDLYRLKNMSEIKVLGMKDILFDNNTIVLIEWAEKIQDMLPSGRIDIDITVKGDLSRIICMRYV